MAGEKFAMTVQDFKILHCVCGISLDFFETLIVFPFVSQLSFSPMLNDYLCFTFLLQAKLLRVKKLKAEFAF